MREITRARGPRIHDEETKNEIRWHVAWEREEKWGGKLMNWLPRENKRRKGRPSKRWEDEIKQEFGTHWKRMAQDRQKWRKDVEAFAQKGESGLVIGAATLF